jgi:F-type H+-transporting ATPase subunit b
MSGSIYKVVMGNGVLAQVEHLPETTQHVETHKSSSEFDPVKPDMPMFFWTWGIFLCLLLILYKIAWKPILLGLNERENKIRTSIEDAEKATTELKEVQVKSKELIKQAELEARSIVSKARETAQLLGKEIEDKARQEAQTSRDNALKDIEAAKNEAMKSLKIESAQLAIELAGRLLGENLNSEKNRALTEKLIGKI